MYEHIVVGLTFLALALAGGAGVRSSLEDVRAHPAPAATQTLQAVQQVARWP